MVALQTSGEGAAMVVWGVSFGLPMLVGGMLMLISRIRVRRCENCFFTIPVLYLKKPITMELVLIFSGIGLLLLGIAPFFF